MSQDSAFKPAGPTVLVVGTSSTSGANATQWSTGNQSQCWVQNGSTTTLYIAFGSSSVIAAQPTTSLPCVGLALPSSFGRCFTIGPSTSQCAWVAAATSAGSSALLFVTPGVGF